MDVPQTIAYLKKMGWTVDGSEWKHPSLDMKKGIEMLYALSLEYVAELCVNDRK